jgi:NTE family protein
VEIEGEHYWDGGLVSNTPLQWVIDGGVPQDMLAFQVDLWSAKGQLPGNLPEVVTRQKEIQYSSRTRASTDQFKHVQRLRRALTTLLDRIPEELREHEDVKLLNTAVSPNVYNIVHLIYRARNHEGHSKDYEFSRPFDARPLARRLPRCASHLASSRGARTPGHPRTEFPHSIWSTTAVNRALI